MPIVNQSTLPNITLPVLGTDEYVMCRDGVNLLGVPVTDAANGMPVLKNTVAPNATTPYLHLTATGTETNIDVAVQPKGTGAFSLQVADGAVAGGNKRGANAVDLQMSRTAATQVASGANSFVVGINNTVVNSNSAAIGNGNSVSGNSNGSVAIGNNNTTTGNSAAPVFAIGTSNSNAGQGNSFTLGVQNSITAGSNNFALGNNNSVTASSAFALGSNNMASGQSSLALNLFATTNGIQGQVAFGHNSNSLGRYQTTLTGLYQVTTGTAGARATADGTTTGTAANQLVVRAGSAVKFMGRVVAYDLTTLDAKEWEFTGLAKRPSAGNIALVGSPTITSTFSDAATTAWTVAVGSETTTQAITVTVTGAGTNQIRWYVEIFAYEAGA